MLYLCCNQHKIKKPSSFLKGFLLISWSHLGSNQGPPDYENSILTFFLNKKSLNLMIYKCLHFICVQMISFKIKQISVNYV